MKLETDPIRLSFDLSERNAANRLLIRLVSESIIRPHSDLGPSGQYWQLTTGQSSGVVHIQRAASDRSDLVITACSLEAEEFVRFLSRNIAQQWAKPGGPGPTGKRAIDRELAAAAMALLR